MNYTNHYGTLITGALEAVLPVPAALKAQLHASVVLLLDSALIIEAPCESFERKPSELASSVRADEQFLRRTDEIAGKVREDGLATQYMVLMREFAGLMFGLFATDAQMDRIRTWASEGCTSSFLMTDRGGPSPEHWKTRVRRDGDRQVLTVDKVWAMGGVGDMFSIVAASVPGMLYPVAYLLSPEQCRNLDRSLAGPSMLDGVIYLQNFAGDVEVTDADRFTRGGPTMLNRLLTMVRPQLIRCLMNHLAWLASNDRLKLTSEAVEATDYILRVATALASRPYGNSVVTQVMAAKFASNELLAGLVAAGAVRDPQDQRDLLAFTKMEGSSYRCLREICTKAQIYNRPAPAKQPARGKAEAVLQ